MDAKVVISFLIVIVYGKIFVLFRFIDYFCVLKTKDMC